MIEKRILIFQTSASLAESLRIILSDRGKLVFYPSGRHDINTEETYDVVLSEGASGTDLNLEKINRYLLFHPRTAVVAFVDHPETGAAVRSGLAADWLETIVKPFSVFEIREKVRSALDWARSAPDPMVETELRAYGFPPSMHEIITSAGSFHEPVLITGERGAGGEDVARVIHEMRYGLGGQLRKFHCSIVSYDTLNKELPEFLRKPAAEGVRGTTFFFDEIPLLPPLQQAGIADFLAELEHRKSSHYAESKHAPVSVLASATGDLDRLLAEGRLLDSLFYRVNIIHLHLQSLRSRKAEIPGIAEGILQEVRREYRLADIRLAEDAAETLQQYHWPGNLVELRNVLTRTAIAVRRGTIRSADILFPFTRSQPLPVPAPSAPDRPPERHGARESVHGPSAAAARPDTRRESSPAADLLDSVFTEMAHELKNPLVSIKTLTQLLGEKFNDPDFRDKYYKIVSADVDRIDSVLTELMDLASHSRPTLSTENINALVASCLDRHASAFRGRKIKMKRDLAASDLFLKTDKMLFEWLLRNILVDALNVIPTGGEARFSTLPLADVEERDTAGPTRACHRITAEYSLFGEKGGGKGEGAARAGLKRELLGLRLALARHVTEKLGGRMDIQHRPEGTTVIHVDLPTETTTM